MTAVRSQILLDYAKWTALSALRSGAPVKSRARVYALLDQVQFREVLLPGPPIRKTEFNAWHKRETEALRRRADGIPAGWSAKLINVYLKTATYAGDLGRPGLRKVLHPPIDAGLWAGVVDRFRDRPDIVAKVCCVTRIRDIKNYRTYRRIIGGCEVAARLLGCPLIEVEQLWQGSATPSNRALIRRQDVLKIVAIARRQLAPVLARSGNILYSSAATLQPGAVYLLGLNPGGSPRRLQWQTLKRVLDELPWRRSNEYLDVRWQSRPPGESTLQRRVRDLAEMLGVDLRTVCATNLIFVRSLDARTCGYPELAELCWPVHEAILQIVRPRLVLCWGNSAISPYAFLRTVLPVSHETAFSAGHGAWQCRMFHSGRVVVVGLPHLSRYAISNHRRLGRRLRRLSTRFGS